MQSHTPIIIIDGPDNVGKGTQIKRLRSWLDHIPFCIFNLDSPVGNSLDAKEAYGIKAVHNQCKSLQLAWKEQIPCIVDRAWPSEYAYSILRKKHGIETIRNIEERYCDIRQDTHIIIFIDEVENIQERDDGMSNYNAEDLQEIQLVVERFKSFSEHSTFPTTVININGKDPDAVEQDVQTVIRTHFPSLDA
jgi:thymidylate kinase